MNAPLFKSGEIVHCKDSESLYPPLLVGSVNPWRDIDIDKDGGRIYTYRVAGINRKGGEITTVNLFESQLTRGE
jgi:hypothetical protein